MSPGVVGMAMMLVHVVMLATLHVQQKGGWWSKTWHKRSAAPKPAA